MASPPRSNLEVITSKSDMRTWSRKCRRDGFKIGFVATMGALHEGHESLVQEAKERADKIVVSIYVNPSQFAPHEDLDTYPRQNETDIEKLKLLGVDAVFLPQDLYSNSASSPSQPASDECHTEVGSGEVNAKAQGDGNPGKVQGPKLAELLEKIYQKKRKLRTQNGKSQGNMEDAKVKGGHATWVQVEQLQLALEGKSRPHFFKGVATVVTKLFNIIEPDVAIFGRKDYQQWRVITKMVEDLDFGIEIVGASLVRESDGLAMSSRNSRLSKAQREQALAISRALREAEEAVKNGEKNGRTLEVDVKKTIIVSGGRVDYVQLVDAKSMQPLDTLDCEAVLLVAAFYGTVRLLDNIELQPPAAAVANQS